LQCAVSLRACASLFDASVARATHDAAINTAANRFDLMSSAALADVCVMLPLDLIPFRMGLAELREMKSF